MTTADWALVISICSFGVSLAGFVWNVWSKFIYPKPKVRTSADIVIIIPKQKNQEDLIRISATNYGPSEVTLHAAIARSTPWFWFLLLRPNRNIALLTPLDHATQITSPGQRASGPFAGGLPKKVAVGENFSVYFPTYAAKDWISAKLWIFGFSDTFGRCHWCSRSNARRFRQQLHEAAKKEQGAKI